MSGHCQHCHAVTPSSCTTDYTVLRASTTARSSSYMLLSTVANAVRCSPVECATTARRIAEPNKVSTYLCAVPQLAALRWGPLTSLRAPMAPQATMSLRSCTQTVGHLHPVPLAGSIEIQIHWCLLRRAEPTLHMPVYRSSPTTLCLLCSTACCCSAPMLVGGHS